MPTMADDRDRVQESAIRRSGRVGRGARATLAALLALAVVVPGVSRSLAQDQGQPSVSIAPVIEARAAGTTPLSIRVTPAGLISRQAFLRIRGLPSTIALSDGHSIAVGVWAVPLAVLPRLRMDVPTGSEGKTEITILLVSIEGNVLAEAKSTLVVVAGEQPAEPARGPVPKASALRAAPEGPPVPLARGPQIAAADRERALKMLQRGNDLILTKDFSAAQHFYKRAAEIGLAEAALALARTFDPGELARIGAVGLRPDPDMARTWYEKARALGSAEADGFLQRLSAVR